MTALRSSITQRGDAAHTGTPHTGAEGDAGVDLARYRNLADGFAARRKENNNAAAPLDSRSDKLARPLIEANRTSTSGIGSLSEPTRSSRMPLAVGAMVAILAFATAG